MEIWSRRVKKKINNWTVVQNSKDLKLQVLNYLLKNNKKIYKKIIKLLKTRYSYILKKKKTK